MKVDVEVSSRAATRSDNQGSSKRTPRSNQTEKVWPVAGTAICTLLLSVVFLTERDADVKQLPELTGAFLKSLFASPTINVRLIAENAAGIFIAALIVLAWYGVGERLQRGIEKFFAQGEPEHREHLMLGLAERIAFGAGACSLLWFALGLVGLFRTPVAIGLLALGVSLATGLLIENLRRRARTERQKSKRQIFDYVVLALMAIPLGCAFIAALAPPTGKDALVYRLALPQSYVAAGSLVDTPRNIYSFLALGAEMNGVWAMLVGKVINAHVAEVAFGVLAFAYFPLLLMLVYGWARESKLSSASSLVAAAMVAGIPTIYQVAASGYADHALAIYIALSIRAAARWWSTINHRWLVTMALALGFALTIKLIAVFVCLPLLLMFLLKARNAQQQCSEKSNAILLNGMLALVCAGLLASPWYLRTWMKTGNPVYPFYVNALGGNAEGWDAERSQLFQVFLSRYGGESKSVLDYVIAPVKLSLQAQPEISSKYDGVIGIAFLVGLPLLLWGIRQSRVNAELKVTAALAGSFYLFWLFTSQQLRFLLPIFPCLAVAMMATAQVASGSKSAAMRWIMSASIAPGVLVIAAWFMAQNPVNAAIGTETREAYLTRRLQYYSYYETINHDLPLNARVWLINLRCDGFYLRRQFVSDYVFEDYTLTQMVKAARDAHELKEQVKSQGITHVLIRHDTLLDYARSPLVDDRKSEAENQARLNLLKSFLTEESKVIRSDAKYLLAEIK